MQRAAHEDYDEIIQDFQAAQGLVQEVSDFVSRSEA